MGETLIPLPQLPRELAALTGQPSPGYRRCYNAALDGRLPASTVNGRWHVRRDDLLVIAERLGLPITAERPRAVVA